MEGWQHAPPGSSTAGPINERGLPYTARQRLHSRPTDLRMELNPTPVDPVGHRRSRAEPTSDPPDAYLVGEQASDGGLIRRLVDRFDDWVTRRSDRRAIARGVTITRIPGTRRQSYRDRRWDRRRECEECCGTGREGSGDCPPCQGTGVLTRPDPDAAGAHS